MFTRGLFKILMCYFKTERIRTDHWPSQLNQFWYMNEIMLLWKLVPFSQETNLWIFWDVHFKSGVVVLLITREYMTWTVWINSVRNEYSRDFMSTKVFMTNGRCLRNSVTWRASNFRLNTSSLLKTDAPLALVYYLFHLNHYKYITDQMSLHTEQHLWVECT